MAMLKPETAFRVRLLADAAVAALVGTRIWPVRAPASATFPLGCYARKKTTPEYNMAGVADFTMGTIMLTWWSRDYDQACALAAAAEAALIPDAGTISVTLSGNTSTLDYVRLSDYTEGAEELDDGSGKPLFYCMQEYDVGWTT